MLLKSPFDECELRNIMNSICLCHHEISPLRQDKSIGTPVEMTGSLEMIGGVSSLENESRFLLRRFWRIASQCPKDETQ